MPSGKGPAMALAARLSAVLTDVATAGRQPWVSGGFPPSPVPSYPSRYKGHEPMRDKTLGKVRFLLVAWCCAGVLVGALWTVSARAAEPGAEAYAAGDFARAAEIWQPLAEAGDASAQFNLALLYDTGRGVERDTARAAAWYRRAAEQGLAAAQYNLAAALQRGRGVPRDQGEALFWLDVASRAEDASAARLAATARDALAAELDPKDVADARARADAWHPTPERARATAAATSEEGEAMPYFLLSDRDVVRVQRRLKELGYDPGPADGKAGPRTRSAIRAFLKDRGIEQPHEPLSSWLLDELFQKGT